MGRCKSNICSSCCRVCCPGLILLMSFQRKLKKEGVEGELLNILSCLIFVVIYSKSDVVLLRFFSSEMIDGCRALLSIGTVTTPVVFDKLLRSLRSLTYNLFLQLKAIWFFFIHRKFFFLFLQALWHPYTLIYVNG